MSEIFPAGATLFCTHSFNIPKYVLGSWHNSFYGISGQDLLSKNVIMDTNHPNHGIKTINDDINDLKNNNDYVGENSKHKLSSNFCWQTSQREENLARLAVRLATFL